MFSYKRCMKTIRKKDKRIKLFLRENLLIKEQYQELIGKYRDVNERLEIICCKYFDLFNRKEEDVSDFSCNIYAKNVFCFFVAFI